MVKRIQGVIAGVLVAVLIFGGVAGAASRTETISVGYRDIRIVIDGEEFIPKDVNGNIVEPFVYEGSTFLPVRAISQALGKQVGWDDSTSTISINSDAPNESGDDEDPVAQIIAAIDKRGIIDESLFSAVSNDPELITMLRRYNELTSYLFGVFFAGAVNTIVYIAIDGFDFTEGVDFSHEGMQRPPSYPFAPEAIAEYAWRIATYAMYPDATQRIHNDSFFDAVLEKEGGGSSGMWPELIHNVFYERPELGATFNEYTDLVNNLGVKLGS